LGALVGIAPQDELEGMLAAQLVGCPNAAMECYRRAMLGEQTFEGQRENLSQANKLSRTYATLLELPQSAPRQGRAEGRTCRDAQNDSCAVVVLPEAVMCPLFDDLVGDCEELRRDFEAESVSGSPIDDELDFGGLRNRQIARRFSLSNARRRTR
jgi:hypothetical protein